jgi:hypothetical protein
MKLSILAALLAAGYATAAYPSTYPFENESLVPAAPREATPSWTFDDADAGGYVYTFMYKYVVTEEEIPKFCFLGNGAWAHQLVVRSEVAPLHPYTIFNCTEKNYILGDYSFLGEVAGQKICEQGECCKEYYDTVTYWALDEPYIPYYEAVASVYEDGACTEMFGEEVYCPWMSSGQQWGCIEQFVSLTDRMVLYPCYDSFYNFFMGCQLYKVSGYMWRSENEPAQYVEDSSAEETNAGNSVYFCPDHVCRPYSYYYPEYAKSDSSSVGSGSGSKQSEESPASYLTLFACCVFLFVM